MAAAASLNYSVNLLDEVSPGHSSGDAMNAENTLPGFPARFKGERVWKGSDMAKRETEWTTLLSDQDREEITEALHHFTGELNGSSQVCPLPRERVQLTSPYQQGWAWVPSL